MKVLLIRPQAPNALSFTKILDNEPLELEYLHTALAAAGIEDFIYDGLIERHTVKEAICREKPDLVAVTGYITQEKWMIEYCKQAKAMNPAISTVIGGIHAQRNFERFYSPFVDFICRSESCDAFVELVSLIGQKSVQKSVQEPVQEPAQIPGTESNLSFSTCNMLHAGFDKTEFSIEAAVAGINGLCYKNQQNEWRSNPLLPIRIDSLPIPDRSFF